jgi:hypothetical protein
MIKALITESKPYNIPNINNSFQKMYASTEDYIITICLTWMIMIGFFIMLTTEIMLLIGLAFPVLIILLLKDKQIINYTLIINSRLVLL